MIRPADLPDGRLEDELRAAFTGATADLAPTRDPWARTQRAVARSRTRRRAGALVAVAVAALTVVGTVLPMRSAAPDPANPEPGPTVTSSDVTTWPTRGNLADRAGLVAEVRQVAPEAEGRAVRSVPFLGDVDGVRVAFVVTDGEDEDTSVGLPHELVVLAGPPSAPVHTWQRARASLGLGEDRTPSLSAAIRLDDGVVRVVVVTPTDGVKVAYSPRPLVDAQGGVSRAFVDLPLDGGVGTARFTGPVAGLTLSVRAGGPPEAEAITPLTIATSPHGGGVRASLKAVADSCSGAPFRNLRSNLGNAASSVAQGAGYEPGEVGEVRAVWCRRVDRNVVMFVAVTMADRTALQTFLEEFPVGGGGFAAFDPEGYPVPRGRAVTHPTFIQLHGELPPDAPGQTVVFSAPGGATAELVRSDANAGDATVVARARLDADGAGVAKTTGDVERGLAGVRFFVVVRDGGGREVQRVETPPDDVWLKGRGQGSS